MEEDRKYMERAMQLAWGGAGMVSPNPMVGAVIVAPGGRIIGEGYHRRYGEAHAEVNAFASVAPGDEHLIPESTIYVTLEPCSHYGKTPPCARLLIEKGIKRCVAATMDPNPKVAGRGLRMLSEAGIEVETGLMGKECQEQNIRFFTAHTKHRPWILLKWAETKYGEMAAPDGSAIAISTPETLALMHKERAMCDAIMVGTDTLLNDNPSLTTREWPGHSPRPVIFNSPRLSKEKIIESIKVMLREPIILEPDLSLKRNMEKLYRDYGVTSLIVEGGRKLLHSFLEEGLYDRIRVETGQ